MNVARNAARAMGPVPDGLVTRCGRDGPLDPLTRTRLCSRAGYGTPGRGIRPKHQAACQRPCFAAVWLLLLQVLVRFRRHAWVVVMLLVAVHTACFAMMMHSIAVSSREGLRVAGLENDELFLCLPGCLCPFWGLCDSRWGETESACATRARPIRQ